MTTMAKMVAFLLMGLGWLCASVDSAAGADKAFLLLHKKADIKHSKRGSERITVSIDLYNVGGITAYDISLNDDNWPSEIFKLASGNTSASWNKLEVGNSLSHSFILEPQVKTIFHGSPAVAKFRVAAKSAFQEALSTPLPELDLLSDKKAELKLVMLKKLVTKYGSLVTVLTLVGIFIYILVSPSKPKHAVKASKKKK